MMYFRAENASYTLPGSTYSKFFADPSYNTPSDAQNHVVYPAVDIRLCVATTQQYTWMNPQTFQLFSSGLDSQYATPAGDPGFYPNNTPISMYPPIGPYEFPDGGNYTQETYDDITNFSQGTLEDAIP
jgi:hypothetical protein